jgi:hypothetical protein
MIENSIDAIKRTLNDKKEIWISINQCEDHDNLVEINVADTGTGMSNPLLLLTPFETTKVSSNNGQGSGNNFGRFGVGLSTAFVYSFKHTHCPMTVITKTYDSKVTKKMKLGFDLFSGAIIISDNVIFVQEEEISGTGIYLVVPIIDKPSPIHSLSAFADTNDKDTYDKDIMLPEMEKWKTQKDENIYEVIDAISDYLRRLDIISVFGEHCEMYIHLNISVGGICFEREYTSKSELYETNSVISDINDDNYQLDGVTTINDRSVSLQMKSLNLDYETKESNIDDNKDIVDDMSMSSLLHQSLEMTRIDLTKKIELNIDQIYPNFDYCISDVAVSTTVDSTPNEAIEVAIILFDKLPLNNKENVCESIIYKGLKLTLWRYVNDTPLLDLFNDAISCMVSQAVTEITWSEFGHILKNDLKKKSWSLIPVKESSDIALNATSSYPAEILMMVNIRSSDVNYANLRKTSLSHDKQLTSSIVNCVSEAMYSLRSTQSKGNGYDLFMSKIDRKQNAIRSYIPILSQSLAKIIYFSQNPSIHQEFMNSVIKNDDDRVETTSCCKNVNDGNFKELSSHLEELISNTYEKSS